MDGRQRPARQGRADRAHLPLGGLAERDLRDPPRRGAIRHPDPAAPRPGQPGRRHSAGVADHRGARGHRRAAHAGGGHVRRRVGARPDLLSDGSRRRLVTDGREERLAPSVRHRPRRPRRARLPAGRGHRPVVEGRLARKGLDGLGRPDGFHERQVDRWTAFLERIKGRELPGSTSRRRGCASTGRSTTSPASCTATTSSPT